MGRSIVKKSFGEWCQENNFNDLLDLWDYELNTDSPFEVGYNSPKKYYFKCKRGIHESFLKATGTLKNIKDKTVCPKCESFGQDIVDTYGQDILDKIWADDNEFDPFEIFKRGTKRITLNCLNDDTHPSNTIRANDFKGIDSCPYCKGQKVCLTNSLAYIYLESINTWSDKNDLSPYDITAGSGRKMWFKCENGIHEDFERYISNSIKCDFKCPNVLLKIKKCIISKI